MEGHRGVPFLCSGGWGRSGVCSRLGARRLGRGERARRRWGLDDDAMERFEYVPGPGFVLSDSEG